MVTWITAQQPAAENPPSATIYNLLPKLPVRKALRAQHRMRNKLYDQYKREHPNGTLTLDELVELNRIIDARAAWRHGREGGAA